MQTADAEDTEQAPILLVPFLLGDKGLRLHRPLGRADGTL